MRVGGEIGVTIRGDNRPYKQVLEDSKRETKKFEDQVDRSTTAAEQHFYELGHKIGESMRTGISKAGNALTLGITLPLLAAAKIALNASNSLEESASRMGHSFGPAKQRIEEFAKSADVAFGLSRRAAYDMASEFGAVIKQVDLSQKAAAALAVDLTKLAVNLGTLHHIKPEEAMAKITDAINGNVQGFKELGISIDKAAIANKAYELGWRGQTKELSDSQKTLARLMIIIDETKSAQGAFAKSSDEATTKSSKLKAEVENLSASFGDELLPVQREAYRIAGDLVKAFKSLSPEVRETATKWMLYATLAGPALLAMKGILDVTRGIIAIRTAYVAAQTAMGMADTARGVAAAKAAKDIALMNGGGILGGGGGGGGGGGYVPVGVRGLGRLAGRVGGAGLVLAGTFMASHEIASAAVDAGNARYAEYLKNNPTKYGGTMPSFAGSHPEKSGFGGLFKESKNLADTFREIANKGRESVQHPKKTLEANVKGEIGAKMAGGGLVGPIMPKRVRGGGGAGRLAKDLGPGWLEEMLAEIIEDAAEFQRQRVEAIESYFANLKRQVFEHGGQRSRVESFLFDRKNDPSSVAAKMGPLDLIKAMGGLSSMDKGDARAEREAQLKDRQKQIEAIREQARESGVLAGIEDTLLKLEQKKGSAFFAYHADRAQAEVKTLILQKEQTAAAQEYIRGLREELGLEKKKTEQQQFQEALRTKMAHANMFAKAYGAYLAYVKDTGLAGRSSNPDSATGEPPLGGRDQSIVGAAMNTREEATRRYKDTIRDLAIEMGGLGDITGVTSERLRLLGQGMSDAQAQHVIDTQRRLREMQELTNIVREGADSMAGVLLDSFKAIGGGFDDMLTTLAGGFRATLAEMAADYLRSQFRRMIFGLVGNLFAGGFGGNADGASGGGQSVVTARGPSAPSAAPSIVVNMPIHTPDVGGFKRSQTQVTSEMVAIALQELKRSG